MLAVSDCPGTAVALSVHIADVFDGTSLVFSAPGVAGMTMFVTFALVPPKANAPCSCALAGGLMVTVYEVPVPVTLHVSPDGALIAAPEPAAKHAASTRAPSPALHNAFMVAPSLDASREARRDVPTLLDDRQSRCRGGLG